MACLERPVRLTIILEGTISGNGYECVQASIELLDSRQRMLGQGLGSQLPIPEQASEFGDGPIVESFGHRSGSRATVVISKTLAGSSSAARGRRINLVISRRSRYPASTPARRSGGTAIPLCAASRSNSRAASSSEPRFTFRRHSRPDWGRDALA